MVDVAYSTRDLLAVFFITFGPGAAFSCYGSLMGWYEHALHSKEMTIYMRMAVFFPFPVMFILQGFVDAYYDRAYGSRSAYYVRMVLMQLLLTVLMCIWMRLQILHDTPESGKVWLLVLGPFLGSMVAPCLGSAIKVAAAMDAGLVTWAQLGNTFGNAVTVLWIELLGIDEDSDRGRVCQVLLLPICICIPASVFLTYAFNQKVFDTAFHSIDLAHEKEAKGSGPKLLAGATSEAKYGSHSGSSGESQQADAAAGAAPVAAAAGSAFQVPIWIWFWCSAQVVGYFSDFILLALMGYFGDAHITHRLAGLVFIAAASGRILALPIRHLPGFQNGPLHTLNLCSCTVRAAISLLLIARLVGYLDLHNIALFVLWFCLHANSMLHSSLTDMTTTMHAPEDWRNEIAHRSLMFVYVAIFSAMLLSCPLKDMLDARAQ